MRLKSLLAGTLLALASITPSHAQTLEEALAMAYTSNPILQAERAGLRATDERLLQARAARLPGVQADASIGMTDFRSASPTFTGDETYGPRSLALSGSQTLYAGGAIRGQIDLAQLNVEIARNNLRQIEHQVLLGAITAFVDVGQGAEVVRIRTNNVKVLIKQLEAAEARFTVGEITRTGVSQAKARLAGARSQLAGAKAQLSVARAAYEKTIGQAPGSLSGASGPKLMPTDLEAAINWAENNSPVLLNARLAELSSVHAVSIAKAGLRPSLSLGARVSTQDNAGFQGAEQDSVSTSLNFSMPLFTGGLNQSKVREAKQQASQARIGVLQARRVTVEQVANAWNGLQASRSVIRASEEQVAANQLAFEGVEQEAQVGLRTTLNVLDAEQELLDAKLSLVSAKRDEMVAAYGLLAATGRLEIAELGVNVAAFDVTPEHSSLANTLFTTSIND